MASGGVLQRLGLALAALRVSELLRSIDLRARRRNARVRETAADVPLPPERLVVLVAGSADLGWFIEGGRLAAEGIRAAVARQGQRFEDLRAALDFGCGCGRVLRHMVATPGPRLYGCDYNADLIDWCRRYLPAGEFATNALTPPLLWPDESFDLAWALSVFTHLPEDLQRGWLADLRRVLRPGGLLIVTVQGASYAGRLTPGERERFDRGELVVRAAAAPGTNLCAAFHPERYVLGPFADGFEVAEFVPQGARGNPHQDVVVLRKPWA